MSAFAWGIVPDLIHSVSFFSFSQMGMGMEKVLKIQSQSHPADILGGSGVGSSKMLDEKPSTSVFIHSM